MLSRAMAKELYGNTIVGISPTVKTIENLDLEDVKNYYQKHYSPSVARLVVVGDIDEKEIMPKLEFLNKWQAKDVVIPPVSNVSEITEPRIRVVDNPFAPSSNIGVAQVSLLFDVTGDYFKNTVANFPLGGNFNSRLNLNLREDKGYTYGIYSNFGGSKYSGKFSTSASVKRKQTANSLAEIMKEISNYIKNGVTEEEMNFTQSSLLNRDVLDYETAQDKAGFLSTVSYYNLNKDYKEKQFQVIKSMTKADYNAQIKKSFDPSKMVIVIVGDKEIVKDQLDKMDMNVVKNYCDKLNVKNAKVIEVE